jgi:hypothetical protein
MKLANLIIKLDELLKKRREVFEIDTEDPDFISIYKRTFYCHEMADIIKILKGKSWWINYSISKEMTEITICKKNK